MAQETFACPECQSLLRYSPNLKPGAAVRCPKCQAQFPVPDPATLPADPPSSPTEEYTDKPGSPRPRFSQPADEDISATRRPAGYGGRAGDEPDEDYPARPLTGDYSIDINQWFAFAGKHYSIFLGPAIGFIFVAGIVSIIPYMAVFGARSSSCPGGAGRPHRGRNGESGHRDACRMSASDAPAVLPPVERHDGGLSGPA